METKKNISPNDHKHAALGVNFGTHTVANYEIGHS